MRGVKSLFYYGLHRFLQISSIENHRLKIESELARAISVEIPTHLHSSLFLETSYSRPKRFACSAISSASSK